MNSEEKTPITPETAPKIELKVNETPTKTPISEQKDTVVKKDTNPVSDIAMEIETLEEEAKTQPLVAAFSIYKEFGENNPIAYFSINTVISFILMTSVWLFISGPDTQTAKKEEIKLAKTNYELQENEFVVEPRLPQYSFAAESINTSILMTREDILQKSFAAETALYKDPKNFPNQSFLSYEVNVINRTSKLVNQDLYGILSTYRTPEARMPVILAYEDSLRTIKREVEVSHMNLNSMIANLKDYIKTQKTEEKSLKSELKLVMETTSPGRLDTIMNKYTAVSIDRQEYSIRLKIAQDVLKKYKNPEKFLYARLDGVTKNHIALSHLIHVTAVKDMNLPIITYEKGVRPVYAKKRGGFMNPFSFPVNAFGGGALSSNKVSTPNQFQNLNPFAKKESSNSLTKFLPTKTNIAKAVIARKNPLNKLEGQPRSEQVAKMIPQKWRTL